MVSVPLKFGKPTIAPNTFPYSRVIALRCGKRSWDPGVLGPPNLYSFWLGTLFGKVPANCQHKWGFLLLIPAGS